MQTVQLQCGSCSNMMAISVEHLGAQVQCPHCAAVVQTPPRSALGPLPGPDPNGAAVQPSPPPSYQPPAPSIQVPERESIFSDPEPSDDLFGGDNSPKVQLPDAPAPAYSPAYSSREPVEPSVAVVEEEEEEQADLGAMRSRLAQERKSSSFAPTLLVFLIPYAIFTTAFLAYLLMTWPKIEHLEYIPDPKPKNGPQKIVTLPAHDLPMPAKLKVPVGQSIRVGQMEITPLKIKKNETGDLVVVVKAKNLSDTLKIVPIEPEFFAESKRGNARPFTFLEQLSKDGLRVYGGDLDYFSPDKHVRLESMELPPGQECIIELSTGTGKRNRDTVATLLSQNGRLQWRMQFRRGLVPAHGVEQSMTTVIAVEFTNKDVS